MDDDPIEIARCVVGDDVNLLTRDEVERLGDAIAVCRDHNLSVAAIPEGAIPVEVVALNGHSVVREVRGEHEVYSVEPGLYTLLPRQVEGDDNPNENGG